MTTQWGTAKRFHVFKGELQKMSTHSRGAMKFLNITEHFNTPPLIVANFLKDDYGICMTTVCECCIWGDPNKAPFHGYTINT